MPVTTSTPATTATSSIVNPLSTFNPGTASNFAAPPSLGVTAGSAPGGGGLTQGTALPNITTTQMQATATPEFYTDYLNFLAKSGENAAKNASFMGPTSLQNQAFADVQANAGNYQPALTSATNLATGVGNTDMASNISRFMSPYTTNVVDALGDVGKRNINQYLAPQATAGAVGSGQFGSKRGAEILGQAINTGLSNLNLAQSQALQTGYGQALEAARSEQANRLAASTQLGNLASTTQALNLGDINAMATLGEQQRALAQKQQLFPMEQLTSASNLLRGATIPTSTASSYTGPIPGAYNASPLAQIAGLGSLATGVSNLMPSLTKGVEAISAGPLGRAVSSGWNALTGGAGNTTTGSYPLEGGGMLVMNADGSQQIIGADGTVTKYDNKGNPVSENTVTPSSPPPSDGMTEQGLYDQEAAYNDWQNYNNAYPYIADDYYNPYDDAGY
jgi:hypothetical protein